MEIVGRLCVLLSAVQLLSASGQCEKFYIQPEDIRLESDKIYVELDGECLPVSVISKDGLGLYAIRSGVHVIICSECHSSVDLDNQSPVCPHPWYVQN